MAKPFRLQDGDIGRETNYRTNETTTDATGDNGGRGLSVLLGRRRTSDRRSGGLPRRRQLTLGFVDDRRGALLHA